MSLALADECSDDGERLESVCKDGQKLMNFEQVFRQVASFWVQFTLKLFSLGHCDAQIAQFKVDGQVAMQKSSFVQFHAIFLPN